jgi:hypothetical protein
MSKLLFGSVVLAIALGCGAPAVAGNSVLNATSPKTTGVMQPPSGFSGKNGLTPPQTVGVKQPPSGSGKHRQPIDPNPGTGTGYGGDSAGGSGSGGYIGDPNSPGHKQF